ncbi:hypothetical protein IWT140_02364 [Secundilactobacillus pentosiphilus]|uniref:Uncharacterized protein n=1 Tax=Secundilactobacillus pentosiphilus TaxID=1714682 RepID=A0A1Z5ISY2_9LACO|nr:hypothetical protein IWT140_02364 [Secundilactobacillus pentosiphilus]
MPVVGELIQFQFGCFAVGGPMNLFKVTDHGLAVFYANFVHQIPPNMNQATLSFGFREMPIQAFIQTN